MRSILPILFSFMFVSLFSIGAGRLLRLANKRIWHLKFFDRTAKYLPFIGWPLFVVLGVSLWFQIEFLLLIAATGLSVLAIFSLILVLTLPLSLIIQKLHVSWQPARRHPAPAVNQDRRRFLKTAAAIAPVLTLGTTTNGFASAFQDVKIPEIDFSFPNLPADLNGFKIWHLSDLHLGYYFQLDNLERLLQSVENQSFDIVLITGDVADDLTQLTEALKLIAQLNTSHPPLVSIGNHEYYRGIVEARRRIDASPVPLLLNSNLSLQVGNTNLVIAGADDPRRMHSDISEFLAKSIKLSLMNAPQEAFKILMSHRPKALDVAGRHRIDLVLSGHTHGGQMGMNGQSIFEPLANEAYLWGKYKKDATQLYTSSGVGHWFPFRLGCPAEAPVITLKKL